MRRARGAGWLFIGTLFGVGSLAAQSTAERAVLAGLKDSLATVKDSAALAALEVSMIAKAKLQRTDPMAHLQLGLVALRLRELGSKKHLDYAISEFEWALELNPAWPWPRYGLGLSAQLAPDRGAGYAGGLFAVLGLDENKKAGKGFAAAYQADSTFTEALLRWTEVALADRVGAPDAALLATLRSKAPRYATPDLYQSLGELERRIGSKDSALIAFTRLRDTLGPTPRVLLELARTIPLASDSLRRALGLPSTDSAYYLGIEQADSEVVAMYRADLAPIVNDSVLALFDCETGAELSNWLREFWGERDARELREPGQRLIEHYRRWGYVMSHFRLPPFRRRYSREVEPFRTGGRDIDDRGVVYLRHGLPVNRRNWAINGVNGREHAGMVSANTLAFMDANGRITTQRPFAFYRPPATSGNYGSETWLYQQPDGDMILHFAAHSDPDDYHLQSTQFSIGMDFEDYWVRGSKIPGTLVIGPFGDPSKVSEGVVRGRRDNKLATTTDSWTRAYEHMLPGREGWFAVGSENGKPLMHLVYAVNAVDLIAQPWRLVPLQIRAAFLDDAGKVVARLDTVQMVNRPKLAKGIVAVHTQLPLPVGATRVHLAVEITPDIGSVHRTDTLRLPTVDGSRLDMSDILIGQPATSLSWDPAPGVKAWLDPLLLNYPRLDTLQVYAEAYGVNPNEPYTVRLAFTRVQGTLTRLLGKRAPAIILTGPMVFGDKVGRINRSVSLSGLEAGDYHLAITVEGTNGKATTERRITIVKKR